jgi:hypothetical protein
VLGPVVVSIHPVPPQMWQSGRPWDLDRSGRRTSSLFVSVIGLSCG